MKLVSFTILITLFTFFSCESSKNEVKDEPEKKMYQVYGKVEKPIEGQQVILLDNTARRPAPVDTTTINKDSTFYFEGVISEPKMYSVWIAQRQNVIFPISNDSIFISADGMNPKGAYEISGTHYIEDYNSLVKKNVKADEELQMLMQEYNSALRMDSSKVTEEKYKEKYAEMQSKLLDEWKEMIWNIDSSFIAIYGLKFMAGDNQFPFYDSLYQKLKGEIPNSEYVGQFGDFVEAQRKVYEQQKATGVGKLAPDFSVPSPDGDSIKLSDFRGQYVLLDFWASWCKPCRMENPNVVKVYNKYKDKNFEIIGLSLDQKKEAWLKAIEQDNLNWKHASSLSGFKADYVEKYGVQGIPHTVLVDPEGKIVAKKLRGESLKNKLSEIFGS